MHTKYTNNLLNLKDVKVYKVEHSDTKVRIHIRTDVKLSKCPHCGQMTHKVHDYRYQEVKDLLIQDKQTLLILKKRRYVCSCGKRFYEEYSFLPRYHRMTNRLAMHICHKLRNSISISGLANDLKLSPTTVSRIFDLVQYPHPSRLPEVLSIDEFKGNAETGKYQCILVDTKKSKIIDILPERTQGKLIDYFRKFPRHERLKVKFFVCDMWKQYAQVARIFFPNAKIITDKYHFIRQVSWAVENVRKRIQKNMIPTLRRYYKRSRSLILKRAHKLRPEEKEALDLMLTYSDDLRTAYRMKELFFDICHMTKYSEQRKAFEQWLSFAKSDAMPEFRACVSALENWHKEILNAFKYGYTNGPTEGYNNKIKVLKRISYGIKNFNRFRNRILHICY